MMLDLQIQLKGLGKVYMKNNNISSRQMLIMLIIFRVTMSLSYLSSLDFPPSNQDNWIIILCSFFYTTLFALPILFLTNRFKNSNMIEYFSIVLGKWMGKIVIMTYGLYFLTYSVYLIVLENQLVSVNLLPETPNWLIVSMTLIIGLYILSKGLIVMFWSIEIIAVMSFVGLTALLLLGLKNVDIQVLFPILRDSTIGQINKGSFLSSLIFVDIFIVSMGSKFLNDKGQINKIFLKSVIYSILIVAISMIVIQTSIGIEQARHTIYPFLIYTRLIKYKSVFERIDIIYVLTWLSGQSGKVSVFLLFSLMCFKEVFNIKKGKWFVFALATIVGIIAVNISNRTVFGIDVTILKGVLYVPFIFTTIIPAFVCIVYFFRRKNLKKYTIKEEI